MILSDLLIYKVKENKPSTIDVPLHIFIIILFTFLINGCGSDTEIKPTVQFPIINNNSLAIPDNSGLPQYQILLLGNSHASRLSITLLKMLEAGFPDKELLVDLAPGSGYLADRINDGVTYDALQSRDWTHVILQAQKYSQSGSTVYPTSAAETWIRNTKAISATPILFPEHPQRDNTWEGQYLYNLHQEIAGRESACVAPIGPIWDEILANYPSLNLHEADGNHASETGHFLMSLIFYEIISNKKIIDLPTIDSINVDSETQTNLREMVSVMLSEYIPCAY